MVVTIYIPTFFPEYEQRFADGEDKEILNAELKKKDWITTDLLTEIIGLYPSTTEKDPVSGKRDHAAFVAKAQLLFPKGRLFASFKQLDQVAKLFLDAWAISKVHAQSKICCSHGVSRGKTQRLHPNILLQRKRDQTEKSKCQCPFEIRYSPQGKPNKTSPQSKPIIFLPVKITGCIYEHKCSMDTQSHRLAYQVNGQGTPDLTQINHIVRMLRDNLQCLTMYFARK